MDNLYVLLKSLVDPIFFLLVMLGVGLILLGRCRHKKEILIARILFTSVFVFLYLFSITAVKNIFFYILEKDYLEADIYSPGKLDVVVVLAGGSCKNVYSNETMPSHASPSRLIQALQIFKMSDADYLVCSGRTSQNIDADAMARVAKRLAIPASRIIVEAKSRNTMQHAKQLDELFDDKSLRIGVVTSGYHMKRSCREFDKYFENIIPLPSEYYYFNSSLSICALLPSYTNLYEFSIAARELIGNLWYRIRY